MIKIEIHTDNDAFVEGYEVPRILRELADKVERGDIGAGAIYPVRDINGNRTGTLAWDDGEGDGTFA